jgi:hypothetical protein
MRRWKRNARGDAKVNASDEGRGEVHHGREWNNGMLSTFLASDFELSTILKSNFSFYSYIVPINNSNQLFQLLYDRNLQR